MAETSKRQTVLPEKLWGGNVRHGTPSSHEESTGDSQSVQDHTTRFGIPIQSSHAYLSLAHIPEEKSYTEYHKYYNIDQAGPGVIALKGFTILSRFLFILSLAAELPQHQVDSTVTLAHARP